MTVARVDHVVVEALRNNTAVDARVDQAALEIASLHPSPNARVDHVVIEILSDNFFAVIQSQTLRWDIERDQSGFFMLF